MQQLQAILEESSDFKKMKAPLRKRVDEILSVRTSGARHASIDGNTEQALPGEQQYLSSGHHKIMIRRYVFASYLSRGKRVLDSCSGLGWGSYLVAVNARHVIAFDKDTAAISFSRSQWKEKKISYICGDGLTSCFKPGSFDVALAMETIEHFTPNEAKTYLDNICSLLTERGILIGSSAFPDNRTDADVLCSNNPFHEYIYTETEFRKTLEGRFSNVFILERNIFLAH